MQHEAIASLSKFALVSKIDSHGKVINLIN